MLDRKTSGHKSKFEYTNYAFWKNMNPYQELYLGNNKERKIQGDRRRDDVRTRIESLKIKKNTHERYSLKRLLPELNK